MKSTLVQKILARAVGRDFVEPGEIVVVEPDVVMSHDNAALVIRQFREIGRPKVWNAAKIVIPLDHRVPAESIKTAEAHKAIREFVREQGISRFHDVGEGVCHQVMVERGYVRPGMIALGTDSHTTSYGCVTAFSTGIGATEMAAVWATGETWLKVPETLRVTVRGALKPGVYAKDLVLHCIGALRAHGADYLSVEFDGPAVSALGVSERFTLCNMAMEMGAKCAFTPADGRVSEFLARFGAPAPAMPLTDPGARFFKTLEVDADALEPLIACPHQVDHVRPLFALAGKRIDQALIGSCTNGRLDDFQAAANQLAGKKVHPGVRLLLVPASRSVYRELAVSGLLDRFLEAGAVVCNPGCGPCLGAHQGLLAEGEVCLSTTNRNFKGRMGSPAAEVYLASPAAVAASAVTGVITLPDPVAAAAR